MKKLFAAGIILSACTILLIGFSGNKKEWKIKIAPDNEPGERIIVSGTAFAPDGKTPVKNINIYVYHTDNKGYYGDNQQVRLNGTIITNEKGQYEYNTIKPASYPKGKNPAHVHYKVWGSGYLEQWFELHFEGDPFTNQNEIEKEKGKGSFAAIQKLNKDKGGSFKCRFDLKLKK